MKNNKGRVHFLLLLSCASALLDSTLPLKAARKRKKTRYLYATQHAIQPVDINPTQPETWVTIFIHGIMSIQPHLTAQNVMRFIRDDVQHTIYSKTVEYMRLDPYFYLNQAMQEFGLKKINLNDLQPGHATNA